MLARFSGWALVVALAAGACGSAFAQSEEFRPSDDGKWRETKNLAQSGEEDEQMVARARQALADGDAAGARDILADWLEAHERSQNPIVPQALLVRGDAYLALDQETTSLYDFERIIKKFPQTEEYLTALERELGIAIEYVHGKKKKFLGIRVEDAGDLGIEMLIRVQERLPASAMAERAAIEMADYYFRERDMSLAAESYDLYLKNYPNGPNRLKAMERRIYASIARFRGPEHDSSGLLDAREQIRVFAMQYPQEAEQQGLDSGLIARLDESAAAQRLNTAEWYLRSGDDPAARLALRRLLVKHPLTASAQRARDMLAEHGWESGVPLPANAAPRDPETGRLLSRPEDAPAPAKPANPGAPK